MTNELDQTTTLEQPLLALALPAEAKAVGELRAAVRQFVGQVTPDKEICRSAELAAAEAANNVVQHAYKPNESGSIELVADYEDGSVELVVYDTGQGLQPGATDANLGTGLASIAQLTDDFSIT